MDEALRHLKNAADQLEQYRQMVMEFERARFETMLPQPASDSPVTHTLAQAHDALEAMKRFDTFVDKVQKDAPPEDSNVEPKEG